MTNMNKYSNSIIWAKISWSASTIDSIETKRSFSRGCKQSCLRICFHSYSTMSNIFHQCRSRSTSTYQARFAFVLARTCLDYRSTPILIWKEIRLRVASKTHEYQRVGLAEILVILFDQLRYARYRWQISSSSSFLFHLTVVRRLDRRQFFSLSLFLCCFSSSVSSYSSLSRFVQWDHSPCATWLSQLHFHRFPNLYLIYMNFIH